MSEDTDRRRNQDTAKASPYRLRLPGFVRDEDIGLGDAVKKATYAMGFRPCGGCERRAAVMNRWMTFTR